MTESYDFNGVSPCSEWQEDNVGVIGLRCDEPLSWQKLQQLCSEDFLLLQQKIDRHKIIEANFSPPDNLNELNEKGWYSSVAPELFHRDTKREADTGDDLAVLIWPHSRRRDISTIFAPGSCLQKYSNTRMSFRDKVDDLRKKNRLYLSAMEGPTVIFFDNVFLLHAPLGVPNGVDMSRALLRRLFAKTSRKM